MAYFYLYYRGGVDSEDSPVMVVVGAHFLLRCLELQRFILMFNLRSAFLGEKNGICVSSIPITRVGLVRKAIKCKESRIRKQPIQVPSNVTIKLEGQDLKVKGPLEELELTYSREVKVDREESGILRVRKAVETRRANQKHGLFRND
ncbi:hypothetical protein REPUB_Repub01dG0063100 [Reevesia pubescens]